MQTITTDIIEATIEHLPGCIVSFRVKAKAPLIASAEKEAGKQIAKHTSIPGFRKGKAPFNIIQTKFPEALKEETQKVLADEAFKACQKEARIPLLGQNTKISYNLDSFSKEMCEMTFKFETEPSVPQFDPHSLGFTPAEKETVSDSDVDETVKRIRLFYAKWESVTDRPAQMGDYVVIDIEDLDTNPPSKPFQGSRFEISSTSMAEWMREIIIGMNVSESKEGKSHADSTETEEVKKEYTEKNVRITLQRIEVPNLPLIDDELAKKVGVATKDEMLSRLRSNMEKQAIVREQNTNRDRLADILLEKVQFDIPTSLLEKEMHYRMNQRFQDRVFQARWKNLSKEEQDKQQEALKLESEKAIRMYYICRRIAQENKITLSRDEMYPKIDNTLDAMFADPATLNPQEHTKEQEAMIFSRLMLSKAQDFLISKILSGQ